MPANPSSPAQDWTEFFKSIMTAKTTAPAPSWPAQINRVPEMLRDGTEFEKYYTPRVVSIGPYHHGNPRLEHIQCLKLRIARIFVSAFLSDKMEALEGKYEKIFDRIDDLRESYEDKAADKFSKEAFARMMLLDGCFILCYICFTLRLAGVEASHLGLKSHHLAFVQQDLFLLENQIPFVVLEELMDSKDKELRDMVNRFLADNIVAPQRLREQRSPAPDVNVFWSSSEKGGTHTQHRTSHLLQLLQIRLARRRQPAEAFGDIKYTFRNVNELMAVGIRFRPGSTNCLADISYASSFHSANLYLPRITVDDSTKPVLLNLVAYEMCLDVPNQSWVTSYICFLDSLIDHADDVKELRKAGVVDNCLGSDEEVAKLFNEIGTDLVPNPGAYAEAKISLQKHFENKRRTWIAELEHNYFGSPWSFLAVSGAVIALFLSGVQAYFSVWSPPGDCDGLCKYINQNHRL